MITFDVTTTTETTTTTTTTVNKVTNVTIIKEIVTTTTTKIIKPDLPGASPTVTIDASTKQTILGKRIHAPRRLKFVDKEVTKASSTPPVPTDNQPPASQEQETAVAQRALKRQRINSPRSLNFDATPV